ncbi:MAG TPA: hypothetical protein EYG47_04650 [Cycloclasticus sp.]|jgi:predicted MFS family arabinose efflux permease|nr:hypothetical protein [Cycloclasticus sp.]
MTYPSTTQWKGIWLVFLTSVATAITATKASPALLAMKQELALSIVQIGWIMSSVAIATVLLGVFALLQLPNKEALINHPSGDMSPALQPDG